MSKPTSASKGAASRKAQSVVIVEDSVDLCEGWSDLLTFDGYTVRTCMSGRELFADDTLLGGADCLVTDYYLPDINGLDLIAEARRRRPGLPAILLTGSKDTAIREAAARLDGVSLLHKPLDVEVLEAAMEELVDP